MNNYLIRRWRLLTQATHQRSRAAERLGARVSVSHLPGMCRDGHLLWCYLSGAVSAAPSRRSA